MMLLQLDDTIAALASPPGPGGRGILRLTGPESPGIARAVFSPNCDSVTADRHASRMDGHVARDLFAVPVPCGLYLWPSGRSYTGQPAAELHTLGSPPLLEAVLGALFASGARPARPGEFTLRAFLSGRVDLVQAEGVLGVIDAHDQRELETALGQLAGGISAGIAVVRNDLLNLLADLEAGLDFVEEDIEFVSQAEIVARLTAAEREIANLLQQSSERMRTTGRRRVVLAGLPNAGKSTLFNGLAGGEAALVSELRGTTRDYLSAELEIGGVAIELVDTAGYEVEADGVMQQAQMFRGEQWRQADLVLWCAAADEPADAKMRQSLQRERLEVLPVRTKADLPCDDETEYSVRVSVLQQRGLAELRQAIAARLSAADAGGRQLLGTTAARCRESLLAAVTSLASARDAATNGSGDEVTAIELRDALDHLGRILGAVYTDDLLDRIFSRFCIGK